MHEDEIFEAVAAKIVERLRTMLWAHFTEDEHYSDDQLAAVVLKEMRELRTPPAFLQQQAD